MAAPYKVLIVPHASYALTSGGMEVQQDQTIAALRRLGVDVELFDPWSKSMDADIVHVFGSGFSHAAIIEGCRAEGKRVVVTSMFMPQYPIWQFAMMRRLARFIPHTTVGLRTAALKSADRVIAISEKEKSDLTAAFALEGQRITVLSNGIEERFYHATAEAFIEKYRIQDFVLCVGTIEARKNQIRLAKALRDVSTPVVFIGPAVSRGGDASARYVAEFEDLISSYDHMLWIKGLQHDDPLLSSAYAAASVHVLVSTAEAQGLVTMEAAAAGAAIVVSDLPQLRELFGADSQYVDPGSESAIKTIVKNAMAIERVRYTPEQHPSWMFTWDDVARDLDSVYRSLIKTPQ